MLGPKSPFCRIGSRFECYGDGISSNVDLTTFGGRNDERRAQHHVAFDFPMVVFSE